MEPKKKLGRPTDNPKDKPVHVRLDDECKEILSDYCEQENVNRAEAIRRGIKRLKPDIKKNGSTPTDQS